MANVDETILRREAVRQGLPRKTDTDYAKLSQILSLRMEIMTAKFEGRPNDARALIARLKTLKEG